MATIATMASMKNLFLLQQYLPQDMISAIYEYDDTYKKIFKDKVKIELWREVWLRWNDKQTMPELKFVMEYLFTIWGIDTEHNNRNPNVNMSWFLYKMHPDDIKFVIGFNSSNTRMNVKVVGKNWDQLFDGFVYSRRDYFNEVVHNEGTNNLMDVYCDETRYLCIDLGQ